eukprot:m.97908 g.97908  ORF g.97908 m.97908 type:complete len:517 (+) comp27021_c0_seq1:149-1699(+)
MVSITMALAVGVVMLLLYIVKNKPTAVQSKYVTHHPIIGCFFWFIRTFETLPDQIVEINRRMGFTGETWSVSFLAIGPLRHGVVVINSPENLKYVTKDNFKGFELGQLRSHLTDFFGSGIFGIDGEPWQFHRKVAVQMFSRNLLREGTHVATEKCGLLVNILDEHVKSKQEFNLQALFFGLTMDVFSTISFGVDMDAMRTNPPFCDAFDRVQQLSFLRYRKPWFKLEQLFGCADEREIQTKRKLMRTFAQQVIDERRNDDDANLGPDLISRFFHRMKTEDVEPMTDEQMIDAVLSFIIAGRDTTASALSWTMLELLKAPTMIDKLNEELKKLMDENYDGAEFCDLTYEQQFEAAETELPFCKAVIMESLRLHPSVVTQGKTAMADDVLPDGVKLKKGQVVMWSPYSFGRDEKLFENANTFDPNRWLNLNANADKGGVRRRSSLHQPADMSDYKYPVFNAGNRLCIGRPFAIMEMKLVLSMLLPRFTFTLGDVDETRLSSLVSPLSHGLPVTVKHRT